jgi:hypothetical protein
MVKDGNSREHRGGGRFSMGKTTDGLVRFSQTNRRRTLRAREMDMLLSTGEQVTIALMSIAPPRKSDNRPSP